MAAQQTQYAGRLISEPFNSLRTLRTLSVFVFCLFGFVLPVLVTTSAADTITEALEKLEADDPDQCTPSDSPTTLTPLAIKYQKLEQELEQSIFGKPIVLYSETGENYVQGDVYALLDKPFATLNESLSKSDSWCELAILHQNIKTCTYGKNETGDDMLQFYVGRKYYQEPSNAHPIEYQFKSEEKNHHPLDIKMTAPRGPFGTSKYLISLEAVPIDDSHSFIHFQYRYQYGIFADLAMSTYLATLGRHKVGFTITGNSSNGEPIYTKGLQGVIERNVMRYIFAIESLLEANKSPEEFRQTAKLVRWYAHISEHPKQLVELTREQYLNIKRREIENQKEMQDSGVKYNE